MEHAPRAPRKTGGADPSGGIRLVILILPDEYQVARPWLYPAPQEKFRAFGQFHGVPAVDPLPTFRRLAAAADGLYLPQDGHLAPLGGDGGHA